MMRVNIGIVTVVIAVSLLTACMAGDQNRVRVGVYQNPPFVMKSGEAYRGMVIEIWENAAVELDLTSQYSEYQSLRELVAAGERGEIDFLVANLAVTSERARALKFTYPWYDSGLRILVPVAPNRSIWQRLLHNGHIYSYLMLFLLFVAVAVIATLVRRGRDSEFPKPWLDGFTTSLAELISMAKSGELPDRTPTWKRNLMVSAWMIFGMALLAYITSSVASAMTMASLHQANLVRELGDLPGRSVGVLSGSGAETYLSSLGVNVHPYPAKEQALADIANHTLDAFVADRAVLEYWAGQNPELHVTVTGQAFHPYKFAFAAHPDQTALADRLSVHIIEQIESGTVTALRNKYFRQPRPAGQPDPAVPNLMEMATPEYIRHATTAPAGE